MENNSPVPIPAPLPVEDLGALNRSDQENMEEDVDAKDTTNALEEELARHFNHPARPLSTFRDHCQVIKGMASGHMTLGHVLPALKHCSHPCLLSAESIREQQVNQ